MTSDRSGRGSAGDRAPYLRIEHLSKLFGGFAALKEISFEVYGGEFVCFLGPSGCGKTTLLRCIGGLDVHTSGTIEQGGRDISALPPSRRDFGIVFQSYALFPNLTIFANVAYGLRSRGMSRAEMEKRVAELLTLVGLPGEVKKYPSQLSGGQQQRVALARALATSPGLLLLDEPLSALDARVRVRLRHEIKELQRRVGVTTVMVTHDQEEALTMADRIVVMNQGVIEQIGTPIEIYRQPATAFVADFVGTMNFLEGTLVAPGRVRLGAVEVTCGASDGMAPGAAVQLCFRPEDVSVRDVDRATPNVMEVKIEGLEFLGSFCRGTLKPLDGGPNEFVADFSINLVRDFELAVGRSLPIALPADRLRVYAKA